MIYLIGGAPRIGKSIIARQFADSLKCQFVSTDELEIQSGQTSPVFFSGDPAENTLAPGELVEKLIAEAGPLRTVVNGIIEEAAKNDSDVVIEGVHLLPIYVANFVESFGAENIRSIFLGSTNLELIMQGMEENTGFNNWPKDFDVMVRRQIASFVETFSHYLRSETKKLNLRYKERSNDFQKDTSDIIKKLTA